MGFSNDQLYHSVTLDEEQMQRLYCVPEAVSHRSNPDTRRQSKNYKRTVYRLRRMHSGLPIPRQTGGDGHIC